MKLKLGLAQTQHPDDGNVLALAESVMARAHIVGVNLLVFPEVFQTKYGIDAQEFAAASQPLTGEFCTAMNQLAYDYGIWMLYTANESNSQEGAKPFNTAVLVDNFGKMQGVYRKVHLFDVGEHCESSKMAAGSEFFTPVQTPWCRLGMAICYDLRFPEQAQAAADAGAQLMIYPAAWVDGPDKVNQWETLLRQRALETGMYVAGVSRCDKGTTGNSLVMSPTGEQLVRAGNKPTLAVCDIDF